MVGDYSAHKGGASLVAGVRGGSVVIGVSRGGSHVSLDLNATEVDELRRWLKQSSESTTSARPYRILFAGAAALGALERGLFESRTSKQFWDLGFDVGSESCRYYEGDGWCAILSEDGEEIELYVSDDGPTVSAAQISVRTGSVVRL